MNARGFVWAFVLACGAEAGPLELEDSHARVEAFRRFEQWAERSAGARAALGDRGAFTETLFAPLRLERGVAGARVRVGTETFTFGEVAEVTLRPLRVGSERVEAGRADDQLVIARTSEVAGRPLRVELALRDQRAP